MKGALSAPTDVKWAISKQRGGSGTEELVPHCYMGQEKKIAVSLKAGCVSWSLVSY